MNIGKYRNAFFEISVHENMDSRRFVILSVDGKERNILLSLFSVDLTSFIITKRYIHTVISTIIILDNAASRYVLRDSITDFVSRDDGRGRGVR